MSDVKLPNRITRQHAAAARAWLDAKTAARSSSVSDVATVPESWQRSKNRAGFQAADSDLRRAWRQAPTDVAELERSCRAIVAADQQIVRRVRRPLEAVKPSSKRTFRIDDDVWDAAAEQAARNGETTSAVVRRAVEAYLSRA